VRVGKDVQPAERSGALARLQRELDALKGDNEEMLATNLDLRQQLEAANAATPEGKASKTALLALFLV
jgi:hypothetical protein